MTDGKITKNTFTDAMGAIGDRYLLEAMDMPAGRRKPRRVWIWAAALIGMALCLAGFRMLSYLFAPGYGFLPENRVVLYGTTEPVILGDTTIDTVLLSYDASLIGTVDEYGNTQTGCTMQIWLYRAEEETDPLFPDGNTPEWMDARLSIAGTEYKPTSGSWATAGYTCLLYRNIPFAEEITLTDNHLTSVKIPLTELDTADTPATARYEKIRFVALPVSRNLSILQVTDPLSDAILSDAEYANGAVFGKTQFSDGTMGILQGNALLGKIPGNTLSTGNYGVYAGAESYLPADGETTIAALMPERITYHFGFLFLNTDGVRALPTFSFPLMAVGESMNCDFVAYQTKGLTVRITQITRTGTTQFDYTYDVSCQYAYCRDFSVDMCERSIGAADFQFPTGYRVTSDTYPRYFAAETIDGAEVLAAYTGLGEGDYVILREGDTITTGITDLRYTATREDGTALAIVEMGE